MNFIEELAWRVRDGEFGNGLERRERLGPIYEIVQKKVIEIITKQTFIALNENDKNNIPNNILSDKNHKIDKIDETNKNNKNDKIDVKLKSLKISTFEHIDQNDDIFTSINLSFPLLTNEDNNKFNFSITQQNYFLTSNHNFIFFSKEKDILSNTYKSKMFYYSENSENNFSSYHFLNAKRKNSLASSEILSISENSKYLFGDAKEIKTQEFFNAFNEKKNKNIPLIKEISHKLDKNELNKIKRKKHDKYAVDNIIRGIKSLSFRIFIDMLNPIIKKIKIKEIIKDRNFYPIEILRINNQQALNSTKDFNLNLLNKTLRDILSVAITKKYNVQENHNKKLINKIYEYNEKNSNYSIEIKKVIALLEIKYEEFFNYYSEFTFSEKKKK